MSRGRCRGSSWHAMGFEKRDLTTFVIIVNNEMWNPEDRIFLTFQGLVDKQKVRLSESKGWK